MKKNATNKFLSTTADIIIETLIASAGLASMGGTHQPEEPVGLQRIIQERANAKNKA